MALAGCIVENRATSVSTDFQDDQYEYSPSRIRRLLNSWGEALALSETPSSARGLLTDGPTPESLRTGATQRSHHGDPFAYANVVADIERAWANLTYLSLEWRTVEVLMHGHSLVMFGQTMGLRTEHIYAAFDRAVAAMAATLNYGEIVVFDVIAPRECAAADCHALVSTYAQFCGSRCRVKTWRTRQR